MIGQINRISLGVDAVRALELCLVCKSWWRLMKKIPEVRYALFSRVVLCTSIGNNYDGNRWPYFAARFGADPHAYLKSEVDIAFGMTQHFLVYFGFEMPFVRCVPTEDKKRALAVAVLSSESNVEQTLSQVDCVLLWYDWQDEKSVAELDNHVNRVRKVNKDLLNHAAVVTNDPWNRATDEHCNVKAAMLKAKSLNLPHWRLSFGNSHSLNVGTRVTECMASIVRGAVSDEWVVLSKEATELSNTIVDPSNAIKSDPSKRCCIQ